MTRTPRIAAPAAVTARRSEILAEFELTLTTRLFGGGAKAREIDEISWLRPPALKGALRHWWRAGHAHLYPKIEDLKAQEDVLFGGAATFDTRGKVTSGPGLIEVEVLGARISGSKKYEPVDGDPINIAYFSADKNLRKGILARVLGLNGRAKVRLTFYPERLREKDTLEDRVKILDSFREQLKDALRLWLTLGGVGARTRRGAGSVAVTREVASKLRIPEMISAPSGEAIGLKEFLGRFCAPLEKAPLPPELFALAWVREVFIGTAKVTAEEAQRNALSVLREVRQDRDHPKSWRGPRDWGQSRWPEADAVRLKARTNAPQHPPNLEHRGKFPRTILGLPIVIHFKKEDHQAGDPKDHTISAAVPTEKGEYRRVSRFASPVLVRPVRVWTEDGERYVPVVVITTPTLPDAVRPVLELTDRATKPLDPRDVVKTYVISEDEGKILLKLENQLIDSGYSRLFTP